MNIYLVIFFSFLIVIVPALIVHFFIKGMPNSITKKMFFVITIVATVIFEAFFIVVAMIPNKADSLIVAGITVVESNINEISPDFTNTVQSKEKIYNVISGTKQTIQQINDSKEAGFVLRLIGIRAYVRGIDLFCENIEANMSKFESSGKPFTVHNILNFVREESKPNILYGTKILQIVILSLSLLVFLSILFWILADRKGWAQSSANVVYGEVVDKEKNNQPIQNT